MRLLLILISLVLLSCSKRVVDLEKVKSTSKLQIITDSSSKASLKKEFISYRYLVTNDSSSYQVNIIPDSGIVNFNPITGFTGKAKSISITGKENKKKDLKEEKKQTSDEQVNTQVGKNVNAEIIDEKKKKNTENESVSIPFIISSTVIFGIIIFLFFIFLYLKHK